MGAAFLLDGDLIEKTKTETWYTTLFLLLFVAALVQYFATAGASPGYLIDAGRAFNEANTQIKECSATSKWYICTEAALCLWTGILYKGYLRSNNISRTCYLVLTNQTAYELVRDSPKLVQILLRKRQRASAHAMGT